MRSLTFVVALFFALDFSKQNSKTSPMWDLMRSATLISFDMWSFAVTLLVLSLNSSPSASTSANRVSFMSLGMIS